MNRDRMRLFLTHPGNGRSMPLNTCMKRCFVHGLCNTRGKVYAKLKNIEKQLCRTAYNCTYTICCSKKVRLQAAEELQERGVFCVFRGGERGERRS